MLSISSTEYSYPLYSADFLRRALASDTATGAWDGLPAIPLWRGTRAWRDGRMGAVFSEPALSDAPQARQPVFVVFVRSGDRWLIDDAIPFTPREADETVS